MYNTSEDRAVLQDVFSWGLLSGARIVQGN